jgi:FixJ family two-component response regulator
MTIAGTLFRQATSSSKQSAYPVVFVIDQDMSVRESLAAMISDEGWLPETFSTAEEFLSHPRATAPHCLVLDVDLPDMSGLDVQRSVAARQRNTPIIFIAGTCNVPTAVQAMKAGAIEFFTKPLDGVDLRDSIRSALDLSREAIGREVQLHQLERRYETLSPREREVMALVVSGRMNKQVGGELGISEITVKAHRGRAMQKMEAASLAHLVVIATKLGVAAAPRSRCSAG